MVQININFYYPFLLQGYNELEVRVSYKVDIFNIVVWRFFFSCAVQHLQLMGIKKKLEIYSTCHVKSHTLQNVLTLEKVREREEGMTNMKK